MFIKHFLVTLLIFLWANYVFAQSEKVSEVVEDVRGIHTFEFQIHKDLKPYIFKLYGNKSNHIGKIEIIIKGKTAPFQSITTTTTTTQSPYKRAKYFEVLDMNFDGYKDIKLLEWWGVTGNKGYRCWLYAPNKKKFIFHKELSELGNPRINHAEQTIRTSYNGGGGLYALHIWAFENGKLVCVEGTLQDYDKDKQHYIVIKNKRINGKIVEVERKIVKEKTY